MSTLTKSIFFALGALATGALYASTISNNSNNNFENLKSSTKETKIGMITNGESSEDSTATTSQTITLDQMLQNSGFATLDEFVLAKLVYNVDVSLARLIRTSDINYDKLSQYVPKVIVETWQTKIPWKKSDGTYEFVEEKIKSIKKGVSDLYKLLTNENIDDSQVRYDINGETKENGAIIVDLAFKNFEKDIVESLKIVLPQVRSIFGSELVQAFNAILEYKPPRIDKYDPVIIVKIRNDLTNLLQKFANVIMPKIKEKYADSKFETNIEHTLEQIVDYEVGDNDVSKRFPFINATLREIENLRGAGNQIALATSMYYPEILTWQLEHMSRGKQNTDWTTNLRPDFTKDITEQTIKAGFEKFKILEEYVARQLVIFQFSKATLIVQKLHVKYRDAIRSLKAQHEQNSIDIKELKQQFGKELQNFVGMIFSLENSSDSTILTEQIQDIGTLDGRQLEIFELLKSRTKFVDYYNGGIVFAKRQLRRFNKEGREHFRQLLQGGQLELDFVHKESDMKLANDLESIIEYFAYGAAEFYVDTTSSISFAPRYSIQHSLRNAIVEPKLY